MAVKRSGKSEVASDAPPNHPVDAAFREIGGGYHHYDWRGPSRLTCPGKESVEDSQSHRPSTALTEHTTFGRCSGAGRALEFSCIC